MEEQVDQAVRKTGEVAADAIRSASRRWSSRAWMASVIVSFALSAMGYGIVKHYVPASVSTLVESRARMLGIDLEIDGWRLDLWSTRLVAEDLILRTRGPFIRDELLEIDELVVEFSLFHLLTSLEIEPRQLTFFRPRIYLERRLPANWNFARVVDPRRFARAASGASPSPLPRRVPGEREIWRTAASVDVAAARRGVTGGDEDDEKTVLSFAFREINFVDLEVTWIEHQAGSSGAGFIHRSMAELHVDDVEVYLEDLQGLWDPRGAPSTRVHLEGRIADGLLGVSGDVGLLSWAPKGSNEFAIPVVGGSVDWLPGADVEVYLENIGAKVIARFMPESNLMPQRGSVTGEVSLRLTGTKLECEGAFQSYGLQFVANPGLGKRKGRVDAALATFVADELIEVDCDGSLQDENYRPIQAVVAGVISGAVREAPREVRQAAFQTEEHYGREVELPPGMEKTVRTIEAVGEVTEELSETAREMRRLMGGPRPPVPLPGRGVPRPRFP